MDVFERVNTDEWVDLREDFMRKFKDCFDAAILQDKPADALGIINNAFISVYQLGRTDAGEQADFIFSDEKQKASVKIAETLIAFRQKLIENGFPGPLADIITREHHMALWSKDFIKMTKEMKDENEG